jgi:hypothetical protein
MLGMGLSPRKRLHPRIGQETSVVVTERDRLLLRSLAVYGLLDTKAVFLNCGFAPKQVKACERFITRHLKRGTICSYPLVGARKYYVLTTLGSRLIDLSDRRAGQCFAVQGLVANFAVMSYCLHSEQKFSRMTRPEFETKFPFLVGPFLGRGYRTRYYLDTSNPDGTVRLAMFVLDFGTKVRRLQRKVRREIDTLTKTGPACAALIKAQLFSITILAFNEQKATRLRKLFKGEPYHVRICYVPGVSELLL